MTIESQFLERKIYELSEQAKNILELGVTLLANAEINEINDHLLYFNRHSYGSTLRETQREAIQQYQQWYSSTRCLLEEYAPELLSLFTSRYQAVTVGSTSNGIMDYLEMNRFSSLGTRDDLIDDFVNDFDKQLSMLLSIPKIVEIKGMSLRQIISVDLVRTEMDEAETLLDAGHHRAAGVLAGVALELHLKMLCDKYSIVYAAKPTIEPLAQALYKAEKINKIEFKHIEYLASIRNKCSHAAEVTVRDVRKLIEEVRKMA